MIVIALLPHWIIIQESFCYVQEPTYKHKQCPIILISPCNPISKSIKNRRLLSTEQLKLYNDARKNRRAHLWFQTPRLLQSGKKRGKNGRICLFQQSVENKIISLKRRAGTCFIFIRHTHSVWSVRLGVAVV